MNTSWWRARRARLLQLWAVGLVASALVTAASALGYLERWQARGLDLLLRLQGHRAPSDVVVIAIDEAAFENLGRRQPVPRDYLARLVRGLQRSGAAAVALDVTLATPTTPAEDAALARAILDFSDHGVSRVVLAEPLAARGPLAEPTLRRAVIVGSPRMPVDDDGFVRHVAPVVPRPDGAVPALALAVAARVGGADPATLLAAVRTGGGMAIPDIRVGDSMDTKTSLSVRSGQLWPINYVGPARSFLTVPSDVVAELAAPDAEIATDNPLRGRIVIVGGAFQDGRDVYQTPHGLMTGIEVHANVVHMLTTRRFIRHSTWALGFAINAAFVLLAGVVLLVLRPLSGTVACVVGSLAIGVAAAWLAFDRGGYWIDFLLPVLATCLMGLGTEALARRRIRDQFGRYLSRELLARVIDDAPSLRGERRIVSVLFSDLRGYTTLAESMAPEAIAAHVNQYFDAMTTAIFANQGMVNDFIGDAVMAVFGAPVADPDHALHAARAALAMDHALGELNARWTARGLPLLHMGIGIHTGAVFAGNVGGHDRIKYTVVGDAVNVGARVEALNKELGTTILVTAETCAAIGDRAQVKDRGHVHLRGRAEHVRVYELLSIEGDP